MRVHGLYTALWHLLAAASVVVAPVIDVVFVVQRYFVKGMARTGITGEREKDVYMPVFKSGVGLAPAWCELTYFEIVELHPGARHAFQWLGPKEKVIVAKGRCRVSVAGRSMEVERGAQLDLRAAADALAVVEVLADATLVRMCGHWGDERGGSGLFTVARSAHPHDVGDPVPYPKTTNFDSHYHDCDEYWILFAGSGTAVSEGQAYVVGAGDCVATRMGHHHDFPDVAEWVQAVYFETTLAGQKRVGHLWEHTHGPAQPQPERT